MLLNNNKGFILIVSYMVITVLVILATSFAIRSVAEQRIASKEKDSIQSLWLAEAGLDSAISQLPSTDTISDTLEIGSYQAQVTSISATQFLITSTGGVPGIDTTDPNNIIRRVTAIVEKPANQANPSGVTSAISANGNVTIKGGADIDGDISSNVEFDFQETFGVSKETARSNADNLYVDPENNVTPVNNITWVDIETIGEMHISDSNWEGSGILIVNGDLRITGGTFSGVIWVIGALWVSGNPVINGSLFVESGAEFDTTVTGNATISFDSDAIDGAFGYLPSDLPPQLLSWKED